MDGATAASFHGTHFDTALNHDDAVEDEEDEDNGDKDDKDEDDEDEDEVEVDADAAAASFAKNCWGVVSWADGRFGLLVGLERG
jgi:hypothetical protein